MKLVIEIPLEGNDVEEADFEALVGEAKEAMGISIEVGRPISEEESFIVRSMHVSAEHFTARIEREDS